MEDEEELYLDKLKVENLLIMINTNALDYLRVYLTLDSVCECINQEIDFFLAAYEDLSKNYTISYLDIQKYLDYFTKENLITETEEIYFLLDVFSGEVLDPSTKYEIVKIENTWFIRCFYFLVDILKLCIYNPKILIYN